MLVATIRALKMHGGVKKEDLKSENLKALEAGMANLARHVENVQKFGIVPIISINRFSADTDAEIALVKAHAKKLGVEALMADHWAEGGKGAADVARAVVKVVESGKSKLKLLYPDEMPLLEKIRTIAKEIYRAKDIDVPTSRCATSSPSSSRWATASCRSASPRRSTASPPMPTCKGAPNDHTSPCARSALRRCRVRGGDLRRDHDHAGPAAGAGRRRDRRRRGWPDRRVVLMAPRIVAVLCPFPRLGRGPRSLNKPYPGEGDPLRRSSNPNYPSLHGNRCCSVKNSGHGSSFSTASRWRRLSTLK